MGYKRWPSNIISRSVGKGYVPGEGGQRNNKEMIKKI